MKKMVLVVILGFIVLFILNACSPSGQTPKDDTTLYFIDAPVNGIHYVCGERKTFYTKTDDSGKHGALLCKDEHIEFFLGSLSLGKIDEFPKNREVYPHILLGTSPSDFDNKEVLKMALLLQSIDDDGDISEFINIPQYISKKIKIKTLKDLNLTDVEELIIKLGNKPLKISAVLNHLVEHSGLPVIEDLDITVNDDFPINQAIKTLKIYNLDTNFPIKILKGNEGNLFKIENDGTVKLNKKLDYKNKTKYLLEVRAENSKLQSNIAKITIHVNSSDSSIMERIKAPIVQYPNGYSKIYTTQKRFEITVKGRKETLLYCDGVYVAKIPKSGYLTFSKDIKKENDVNNYKIRLRYSHTENESVDTTLTVIHDDEIPTIKTENIEPINENSLQVKTLLVEDNFMTEGLLFSISGGVDKNLFSILPKKGVLSFKNKMDYENPKDKNKDNIYEVEIKVFDKTGNFAKRIYKIKILNQESVPTINNFTATISDNRAVNDKIGTLTINYENSSIKTVKLIGADSGYFTVDNSGVLRLKKKLFYQSKKEYNFDIQATNNKNEKSNRAKITIKVISANSQIMDKIQAPKIVYESGNSKIYTNKSSYTLKLSGRKNTNVYYESTKIGVVASNGEFKKVLAIDGSDKEVYHKVYLGYNNGVSSDVSNFKVIKDSTNPTIKTATNIFVNENVTLTKSIDVDDNFKKEGVTFSLNGGVDKAFFTISSTSGVLKFKNRVDHENPKDSDKNNIYEVKVKVVDKAGNSALKLFKISVANQESVPTIENFTKTVSDDKEVGYKIGTLTINNENGSVKLVVTKGDDADSFTISTAGVIKLKQLLLYQSKKRYEFTVYALSDKNEESNRATVIITVKSANPDIEKSITAPTIEYIDNLSKIYTNKDSYSFKIKGRKGTNVYFDNKREKIGVIESSGYYQVVQSIKGEDRSEEHTIHLGYDNGVVSKVSTFTVIKDTKAPDIITSETLEKEENIKLITNIDANDTNKKEGFKFRLKDEKDSQYFTLLYNGELSFKELPNFEEPLDNNKDNSYNLTIVVIDKADNSSTLNLTIKIVDILDSKPTIEPFEEDITTSAVVGSTIGTVKFFEGNSPLIDVNLTGDGADKFRLDRDGTLTLLSSFNTSSTYNLTITLSNEFGLATQNIKINVINGGVLAKAQMGRLIDSTVKIIKINRDNTQELIYTTTTNASGTFQQLGSFDMQPNLLNDNDLYLYEVTEGYDVDINNDGIQDNTSTENRGVLRLVVKGSWVKNASHKIRITPLSEFLYDYVAKYVKYDYNQIESKLNEISKILLSESLDADTDIDAQDIMIYNPLEDSEKLYATLKYNNSYLKIVDEIRGGDSDYTNNLFHSYIINYFPSVDMKIINSFAYTIDVFSNGEFRIYDIKTGKVISRLKLTELFTGYPKVGTPTIFVNLADNRVYISNLHQKIYAISIQDIKNPKILGTYDSTSTTVTNSKNNHIFIKSIFSVFGTSTTLIDFTDPSNPTFVKNLGRISAIHNNLAYVTGTGSQDDFNPIFYGERRTVKVYDISNFENIVLKKEYILSIIANSMYVTDNYIYTTNQYNKELKIYKIQDTELILQSTTAIQANWKILGIKNNLLYLKNSELEIFNIENRTKPYLINAEGRVNPFESNKFISRGEVIDRNSLNLLDESQIIINHLNILETDYTDSYSKIIKLKNNLLYYLSPNYNKLYYINIENFLEPKLIAVQNLLGKFFFFQNDVLYLKKENNKIDLYNIDDLTILLGSINLRDIKEKITSIYIKSNILYASCYIYNEEKIYDGDYRGETTIYKVDIQDIANPNILGKFYLAGEGKIIVKDEMLYMAWGVNGLKILNWSNNELPSIIYDTYRSTQDYVYLHQIYIYRNYLYLIDRSDLFIMNLLDNTLILKYDKKYIWKTSLQDNLLLLHTEDGFISVDITYPDNLNFDKKYYFKGGSSSFILKENILYLGRANSLMLVDLKLFNKSNL